LSQSVVFVAAWSLSNATRRVASVAFQESLLLYWLPAAATWVGLAAVLWRATRPRPTPRWQNRLLSGAVPVLVFLGLLAMRWPVLGLFEQNPDESQAIAGAITLAHDPSYWRAVDNGTHGPLVSFALVPGRALGVALDYGWARAVGLLMMWGTLLSVYGVVRRVTSEPVAALMMLPAVTGIGLMSFYDFVAYNAEHPTLLLLCTSGYCLARLAAAQPGRGRRAAFSAGLLLGLVPLSKLQGAPVALTLAGGALVILAARRHTDATVGASALWFAAGLCLPAVALVAYLWHEGLFADFWAAYVTTNVGYVGRHGYTIAQQLQAFLHLVQRWHRLDVFAASLVWWNAGVLLLLVVSAHRLLHRRDVWLLGSAMLIVIAAAYSVYRPGNDFNHYLLLLLPPLWFVTAGTLATGLRVLRMRRRQVVFAAAYTLVCLLYPLAVTLRQRTPLLHTLTTFVSPWPGTAVAKVVRRYAYEDEPLLVWGWMARYHVLTGMRQATPCSTPVYEMAGDPFWRARFMTQLLATNPPVFVDAVGPGAFGYSDRSRWGYERYPWLRDRIESAYRQVADVEGARVYVLKDRLESLSTRDSSRD